MSKKERKKIPKDSPSAGDPAGRVAITATLFNDPVCPWGYSASPALRTLEWRYRDQISWRLVLIGLSSPDGPPLPFTPDRLAALQVPMRDRFGMPFSLEAKARPFTSSRSCQAIAAVREVQPGFEWKALRALQLLFHNTPLLPDDDSQIESALETVGGLDAGAAMAAIDSPSVVEAFAADRASARSASGSPSEMQGKTADSPEGIRYTAPSLILSNSVITLEAGGFQPLEAYDLAIANLAPGLDRRPPAESPSEALAVYPGGLTTQEVAALMTEPGAEVDRTAAEQQLIVLAAEGGASRVPLGNDALWIARSGGPA